MSVREIHAAVEHSLGERVPMTTVRDALSVHSRGSAPRFLRVRRGVYEIAAVDRNDSGAGASGGDRRRLRAGSRSHSLEPGPCLEAFEDLGGLGEQWFSLV